jgi:signal transduction histidine kinase
VAGPTAEPDALAEWVVPPHCTNEGLVHDVHGADIGQEPPRKIPALNDLDAHDSYEVLTHLDDVGPEIEGLTDSGRALLGVKIRDEALAERDDSQVLLRGARDDHGKMLIQVIDNGPGIDAAHLDDIFLPFFTTKRSGSGVGLSVSRQIMALNKGSLTVKTVPGTGSEFTLRFR